MSTDPTPISGPPSQPPLNQWFNRLGLSGKLLVGGGLGGVLSSFLPAMSVSGNFGGISMGTTASAVNAWQGKIGLICYIAAIVLAWILYQGRTLNKNLVWAAVGVGVAAALMAVWILIDVMRAGGGMNVSGMGMSASPGIGAFTNALSGVAVAVGAFLKAREEKLL